MATQDTTTTATQTPNPRSSPTHTLRTLDTTNTVHHPPRRPTPPKDRPRLVVAHSGRRDRLRDVVRSLGWALGRARVRLPTLVERGWVVSWVGWWWGARRTVSGVPGTDSRNSRLHHCTSQSEIQKSVRNLKGHTKTAIWNFRYHHGGVLSK